MAAAAPVDSRQYRLAFTIGSADEWPADFGPPEGTEGFRTALFLPRDDAGWFGRSRYPPRIVTLYTDRINIHAHPASDEPPARLPLSELQFVEDGHILLHGWLRLVGVHRDVTLSYNTRSRRPVDRFWYELRDTFASPAAGQEAAEPVCLGEPLDLKFGRAQRWEVASGEPVRIQLFHPARRTIRRWGIVHRESWTPGDLLLATDRRLLWITDRDRGRHEPYGCVTRYAPTRLIGSASCERTSESVELRFRFQGAGVWRVPLPTVYEGEAKAFLEALESRSADLWRMQNP